MSPDLPAAAGGPDPRTEPVRGWRPGPARFAGCAHHGSAPGTLDETARRLSHEELAVASALCGDGHDVRSVAERRGGGRTADLSVCGASVEIKTWDPPDARSGRRPTARSVYNKLVAASEQGHHAVLYGRERGLARSVAMRGVAEFARSPEATRLGSVRVLGDAFDLTWTRDRIVERAPGRRDRPSPTPGFSLGR